MVSRGARGVYEVPAAEGPAITYPAALVQGSTHAEATGKFLDYLASPAARAIFSQYGFSYSKPVKTESPAHVRE
jgi:molybdate transport system substrate-binding protein